MAINWNQVLLHLTVTILDFNLQHTVTPSESKEANCEPMTGPQSLRRAVPRAAQTLATSSHGSPTASSQPLRSVQQAT